MDEAVDEAGAKVGPQAGPQADRPAGAQIRLVQRFFPRILLSRFSLVFLDKMQGSGPACRQEAELSKILQVESIIYRLNRSNTGRLDQILFKSIYKWLVSLYTGRVKQVQVESIKYR
jgi:hypothetical protein